ncbi:MAG: glycosyltransferase [Flavobacteriales bacterium]|nr:glycosyltransferase [Flavobacteriales bacterium]
MKLLLVAAANSIHTRRWAHAFAEHGHEVHVVSQHAPREPYGSDVRIHLLPHHGGLGYVLNRAAARRIANGIRPDAINAHYASGYGTLAPRIEGVPLILNVWGSDVYEFPDTSLLHRWLLRRNLLRADAVVSTSRVMAERTRLICPDLAAIDVVPFGVDTERFSPMPKADGPMVIGTVKTLAPKYGIDTLIQAFGLIAHESGLEQSRLRLVGDGPQRKPLEALARSLRITDRVDFIGNVPHDRVPAELLKLDVYAALSRRDSESFGVAVIEASACGLPVVVSRVGGLPEVVDEGRSGLVVPKEDPKAAADALLSLARDASLRKSMGEAGRALVLARYAWSDCVDRQLTVIEAAIETMRGS